MAKAMKIELPEQLTINHAHACHDEWEVLLEKPTANELIVTADKVSRVDTAGLQLLLALVQSSKEASITVAWESPSVSLIEAADVLGLTAQLHLH